MAGAVAAGKRGGGHATFAEAQAAMGGVKKTVYKPHAPNHKVYLELFALYRDLHDAFGTKAWAGNLHHVMKELLAIKDRERSR
jgi:L-ribulokinase